MRNGSLRRIFGVIWHGVDTLRRVTVNVLFLIVVLLLVAVLLGDNTPSIEDGSALVVAPHGEIVDQLDGDVVERAVLELLDQPSLQTLLRDLVTAIDRAKDDERIALLVLDLRSLTGAGLSKVQDLSQAITRFRQAGKEVLAYSDSYGQTQYYLAAHADQIHVDPMGMVMLEGYSSYRNYYKEGLDKLEIEYNVFRVGDYKSAAEPYLRNDMSDKDRVSRERWLGELWSAYRDGVSKARDIEITTIDDYTGHFAEILGRVDGDAARAALDSGLVDQLTGLEQFREQLIGRLGEDPETGSFPQIHFADYLAATATAEPSPDGDAVGVIVASGTIADGSQPPGAIGGDSTSALVRQAREDDSIRAIVLRVDSGGGSAFASEVIRREIVKTSDAGKPVVVSMGSVAASGGYWISMEAAEIWASPTTITGSIGIYGAFPTFERTLANLGIHTDGVGTTPLAGGLRPDRALGPEIRATLQQIVENGYHDFVSRVAAARGSTFEEIDAIAGGQVWTGLEAVELGLVDRIGGLEEAIASAGALAGLDGEFAVRAIEGEQSLKQRLMSGLTTRLVQMVPGIPGTSRLAGLVTLLQEPAQALVADDPLGLYAVCSCDIR